MSPSLHRLLQATGSVIAVLLLGLAFYPGTFATPYVTAQETPKYTHTIVPESSSLYDEFTEDYNHEVYQYDELSPVGQELFDQTRAAEPRPQYNGERRYIPDVCRDFMLVCDEYSQDELPEQFTYGTELDYEDAFVFIEDGDDRYLLQTGITGHLFFAPFPIDFAIRWLTVLPLALFITVVTHKAESDRVLGGAVGGGIVVATVGILAPYIEMVGLGSARKISILFLAGVWIGILCTGGYWLYQRVTDGGQRNITDDS